MNGVSSRDAYEPKKKFTETGSIKTSSIIHDNIVVSVSFVTHTHTNTAVPILTHTHSNTMIIFQACEVSL